MADQPQLIYLEPDDEITSLVRRLRAAEGRSVVIVAPGRSRATSSAVALRLLAQVATEENRTLALVADTATRAVATEAGIAAFASVAEATSGSAAPDQPTSTPLAPIHVVRGIPNAASFGAADRAPPPIARSSAADETMAVKVPPPSRGGRVRTGGRGFRLPKWPWLAGLLVVLLSAFAALLPGATVRITPTTLAVGPKAYQVLLPIGGRQSSDLRVTRPGTATGQRLEQVAATGTVTFSNWNNAAAVAVPQGTSVSVGGGVAFGTNVRIVVARATTAGNVLVPSQATVGITAVVPGLTGNLAAGAIDTVDDRQVRGSLQASSSNRLVTNPDATTGGLETPHTVIQQSDVDSVVAAIQADLASRLAAALAGQPERLYAGPPASEVPAVVVPPALVGKEDTATFELSGSLAVNRPYVARADVEAAARARLVADATAAPGGTSILPDSIGIQTGTATANGDEMTIAVSVQAAAAAAIDATAVRDKVAGMTAGEARAALAPLGKVEVELWPTWLDRLPRIPFRINVERVAPAPAASPSG